MMSRRKISHKISMNLKMFEIAVEGRKCVCVYVSVFLPELNMSGKKSFGKLTNHCELF